MSENEIREIFTRSLPSVADVKRSVFLDGMQRYHAKFNKYREDSMNYEADEQYRNEWFEIAVMDKDDYWLYSPWFSKVAGLVLNELFKTTIKYHSLPDPLVFDKCIVLLDEHANRWIVSIKTQENEPEKVRVCMRFPRSVPKSSMKVAVTIDESELSSVDCKEVIQVTGTGVWYD